MSIDHTVVLLPALGDTDTQTAGLRAALSEVAQVLMPDIGVRGSTPVILEEPALAVLDALPDAHSHQVVLLGRGWGSMVALQIAATRVERVAALLLSTNARLETIVVRSLYYSVLSLCPAAVVQQLGARPSEVLNLLDLVRPADFRALAEQVPAPALVIVGEQDVANRGPSTVLARSLPLGNLRVVPQAGAGWRTQQPQVVARLLVEFLSSLT